MRQVAAFDFDGTITRRDTLVPFFAFAAGRRTAGRAAVGQLSSLRQLTTPGWRDQRKIDTVRALFRGWPVSDYEAAGERYAATLPRLFRPATLDRIRWHRDEGHELVIVSASLEVYLRHVAPDLGVDHVIAVELQDDGRGRLTGELAAPNVRGPQKARRLRSWLGTDDVELWAYGDSAGDDHLLAMADHPTWVGARARRRP